MAAPNRLLIASSVASAASGTAAMALGLAGGAPGPGIDVAGVVLVFTGAVALVVGVYGAVTWVALARPPRWADHVATADRFAADGKPEYARTFYEEALAAGADPEVVEPRLAML